MIGAGRHLKLGRASPRPALVALAGFSVLTGVGLLLSVAGTAWAADAHRSLLAARSLLDGAFGTVEGYLYSPLAAALTIPALVVPEGVAIVCWILVKVAILILGATLATRDLRPMDRLLVAAAVIAFLPVLYDLELGNVTIVLAATIAVVAWTPDRATAGIPLGIMLAATPKPQLIPVLIWMAVFRRRALVGALGAAGFGTLAAFAVFGPGPFERWTAALLAPPYLTQGNLALSTLPPLVAIPVAALTIAGTLFAMRRGPAPGLVAALACGLLVSPYTIMYAAGVVLVAAPGLARASPRGTLAMALLAPVALVVAFPLWVASFMLLGLNVPRGQWPRGALLPVSEAGSRVTGTQLPPMPTDATRPSS
jgi:Glycosyltransferase family 87